MSIQEAFSDESKQAHLRGAMQSKHPELMIATTVKKNEDDQFQKVEEHFRGCVVEVQILSVVEANRIFMPHRCTKKRKKETKFYNFYMCVCVYMLSILSRV